MKPPGLQRLADTRPLFSTTLIRLMLGAVFLSEGIQKWIQPEQRGAGRFEKIGLPWPDFLGYFVGTVEILCGALLLVGLWARIAAVPLLTIMIVALLSTKVPILINDGFWQAAHAARTDFSMTIGSIFIIIMGAGRFSLDAATAEKSERQ